jgi:hypothetical protein
MRLIGKLIVIIILLGLLLGASAYIILYKSDTEPPKFEDITGNISVTAGQNAIVTVLFSDNVNVTVATLYYKIANATSWSSESILSGIANIPIPSSATSNYYYYITVDDAAGNGPVGDPSTDGSMSYIITVSSTNDHQNLTHYVFIEEGTATTCQYCPNIGSILHNLYTSHDYRFFYVNLVSDMNTKAADRLTNYNEVGNPTVYIDGGYNVIMGGTNEESTYVEAIRSAESRDVPAIQITVNAEYDNTSKGLLTKVIVENFESNAYTGHLRVYLTEIISKWIDYAGNPYHYAFLDYIFDEDISINSNDQDSFSSTRDISDLDPENLMIVAVVFNSESHTAYSNPPNENPFDAYYADAVNATVVVEGGNLPPSVGISFPEQGKIFRHNKEILKFLYKTKLLSNTWIVGPIKIIANASDDLGIEKVEFLIEGKRKQWNATIFEAPYEFNWRKFALGRYTITVTAFDKQGKISTDSMDVIALIRPFIF